MASAVWNTTTCSNLYIKEIGVDGFVQLKQASGRPDFAFVIEVHWSDGSRRFIKRTYQNLLELQRNIKKNFGNLKRFGANNEPSLPGKWLFRCNSSEKAENKETDVNRFVRRIIRLPATISRNPLILSFFESRPTDPKPTKSQPELVTKVQQGPAEITVEDLEGDDFFFDMDMTQVMLSGDRLGYANDDETWCNDKLSFCVALQRAGSEPVLCGDLYDEVFEDSDYDSGCGINNLQTHHKSLSALHSLPGDFQLNEMDEDKTSPEKKSSKNHGIERHRRKVNSSTNKPIKRSKSLLAKYTTKLPSVEELDNVFGSDDNAECSDTIDDRSFHSPDSENNNNIFVDDNVNLDDLCCSTLSRSVSAPENAADIYSLSGCLDEESQLGCHLQNDVDFTVDNKNGSLCEQGDKSIISSEDSGLGLEDSVCNLQEDEDVSNNDDKHAEFAAEMLQRLKIINNRYSTEFAVGL